MPAEFITVAVPNGELAPNLVKRGIKMNRYPAADIGFTFFNMKDPVVGGYEPAQVALRRAIGLAYDVDREIRLARKGQMVPAQGLMPGTAPGAEPSNVTQPGAPPPMIEPLVPPIGTPAQPSAPATSPQVK